MTHRLCNARWRLLLIGLLLVPLLWVDRPAGSASRPETAPASAASLLVRPRPGARNLAHLASAQAVAAPPELAALGVVRLLVPSGQAEAVRRRLQESGQVEFAEPDVRYRLAYIPDDPLFPQQWALTTVQAPAAWDYRAPAGPPIAIVDTGIDLTHPDLRDALLAGGRNFVNWYTGVITQVSVESGGALPAGQYRVWVTARRDANETTALPESAYPGPSACLNVLADGSALTVAFTPQSGARAYGVYLDRCDGAPPRLALSATASPARLEQLPPDTAPTLPAGVPLDPADVQDDNGHGTHVAGIAAALTDNGQGIAGLGWGARLRPFKAFDAQGLATAEALARAIVAATDSGARIINVSAAGPPSQTVDLAVQYAWQHGALVVAAAGNSGSTVKLYPAHSPHALAVIATTQEDRRAGFSNYGFTADQLVLAAPGVNILSTWLGGAYVSLSGTSMATPHVSGLAALLLARYPWATAGQIGLIMRLTADKVPVADYYDASGFSSEYGYGRINAYRALTLPPLRRAFVPSVFRLGSP